MRFTAILSSLFLLATLGLAAPIAEPEDVVARGEGIDARAEETYCYIKRGSEKREADCAVP
ncbi:hypothetical protein ASPZODRAFT_136022 [Penicilliopsis zonata CBS 506.65]|uniref:Uncharacterized protein n=1 Tax=Penicilliopsis zonata CBS 506.65 TaxID=1073090 RepID=A0A1L9S8T1_9EURO|nr:hypothetical protein ASPZODRAFT_136022 [Penicilliopsis zonata CBS 506.65]OJJ43565.1 hypothetical protein ASPZODRAFT_136022 [Penicilliopsis zonata CBS 506.65]